MNRKFVLKVLRSWIPIAAAVTLLCGVMYLMIQQTYRMDANDPQLQYAEGIRTALEGGTTADQITGATKIDIAKSLDPFIIIYDTSKKIVGSSAILGNESPSIPTGVLDEVAKKGEERVTWQPQNDVRIATVVLKYKDGFILVGRNLRETESRVAKHGINMLIGWTLTLMATLFTAAVTLLVYNRLEKQPHK